MKKTIKIPAYSGDEIKEIEKEFDTKEGWVMADEIFGKDRIVESVFISVFLDRKKKTED